MRRGWAAGMVALALLVAACGGAPSSAGTGSGAKPASQPASAGQNTTEARHEINKEFAVNGLKVKIGEIVVRKNEVVVGMTVTNASQHKLSFYPDQGNVVVGNLQLDANLLLTEGSVSGDIEPGVAKEGVIHFSAPAGKNLDPNQVKQVKLNLGKVFDNDAFTTADFTQTIDLGA